MRNLREERIGEIRYNSFGSKMELIEYRNAHNIDIYFEEYNCVVKNREYYNFKNGNIECVYEPKIYGVGYIGEGKYTSGNSAKHTRQYEVWVSMLRRCYDPYYINKYITYKDVVVDKDFHNFQNFCIWDKDNYYEIPNEKMHLDKDILCRAYELDDKIYSSNTCIYVPSRINMLFTKRDNHRGNYPIGVSWHKASQKYIVHCNDSNCVKQDLGLFTNSIEAFNCYKNFKEKVIKEVADEYKYNIPNKLYQALYLYEVRIND